MFFLIFYTYRLFANPFRLLMEQESSKYSYSSLTTAGENKKLPQIFGIFYYNFDDHNTIKNYKYWTVCRFIFSIYLRILRFALPFYFTYFFIFCLHENKIHVRFLWIMSMDLLLGQNQGSDLSRPDTTW